MADILIGKSQQFCIHSAGSRSYSSHSCDNGCTSAADADSAAGVPTKLQPQHPTVWRPMGTCGDRLNKVLNGDENGMGFR